MYECIKYEKKGGVAVLTMNRPDQRNAVNAQMRSEMLSAISEAAADAEVNVLVLAAEGKSFCAGRDVTEVKVNGSAPLINVYKDYGALKVLTDALYNFPKPLIAAVKGHALGLGNSMITYCDLVVAGEGASFGFPEININIVPGIASVHVAKVLGRRKLTEMMLLGKKYAAGEALTMGMINEVVNDDEVLARAMEWANKLAGLDPTTVTLSKQFIHSLGEGATYDFEAFCSLGVMSVGFANKNKR